MFRPSHLVPLAFAALAAVQSPAIASAAVIVVDTLADVVDPPFNADDLCGTGTVGDLPGADGHISLREALSAANDETEPHRITFAAGLAGGTIALSFDDLDADSTPDLLPFLCGGDITIDGDINADDAPDITLKGNAALPTFAGMLTILSSGNVVNGLRLQDFPGTAIVVFHPFFFSSAPVAADNAITNNHVAGGRRGIVVQASTAAPAVPGHVSDTTIDGNTVSDAREHGIFIFVGDGPASSIARTSITNNRVLDNGSFGILLSTNFTVAGINDSISATIVRNNEVAGNAFTGIGASAFAGQRSTISNLSIDDNELHDNGFSISVHAGVCGATESTADVSIVNNRIDTSGILVTSGTNILCDQEPRGPASDNTMTATISGNSLGDQFGPGLLVFGGLVNAHDNEVTATVTDNIVAGLTGISIAGGVGVSDDESGPADRNHVTATIRHNRVDRSFAGIGVAGGASGEANDNTVDVDVEDNVTCSSSIVGIQCFGGQVGMLGLPSNEGTGNAVTGSIAGNLATTVMVENGIAGNTCNMQQQSNAPCHRGDAGCDGRVTAADITELVLLSSEGERAFCALDDASTDGSLDGSDISSAIAALFA